MDLFAHVRIVMGMIVSLGLTHMLKGISSFIQHPSKRIYPVHAAWVVSVILQILHFWWWEFSLRAIPVWNFGIFAFLILYAFLIYLQCASLFPDSLSGYDSIQTYFMARRTWFFSLVLTICLADIADTAIKGRDYVNHVGWLYWAHLLGTVIGCLLAIRTRREWFHRAFVAVTLICQFALIGNSYWRSL